MINEFKKRQPGEFGYETVRDGQHLVVRFTRRVFFGVPSEKNEPLKAVSSSN